MTMTDDLRCEYPPDCYFFDCDYVFQDVAVLPAREGGSIIQWTLDPRVRDEGEYRYTLQTENAGVGDLHAWSNVVTQSDTFLLTDLRRRLPGVYCFTHYRVKLETGERVYFSRAIPAMGKLGYEDYRVYVSVLRAEEVQLSRKTGIPGLIYKRKISGRPCPRCRDFNTEETRDSGCRFCFGTGWLGGYYRPVPCRWFDVLPGDTSIRYETTAQGPITNTRFEARTTAVPLLISGDLWLNQLNSERFRIMQIEPIVEQKGVPVVYKLAMERLPFSDIVYTLPKDAN